MHVPDDRRRCRQARGPQGDRPRLRRRALVRHVTTAAGTPSATKIARHASRPTASASSPSSPRADGPSRTSKSSSSGGSAAARRARRRYNPAHRYERAITSSDSGTIKMATAAPPRARCAPATSRSRSTGRRPRSLRRRLRARGRRRRRYSGPQRRTAPRRRRAVVTNSGCCSSLQRQQRGRQRRADREERTGRRVRHPAASAPGTWTLASRTLEPQHVRPSANPCAHRGTVPGSLTYDVRHRRPGLDAGLRRGGLVDISALRRSVVTPRSPALLAKLDPVDMRDRGHGAPWTSRRRSARRAGPRRQHAPACALKCPLAAGERRCRKRRRCDRATRRRVAVRHPTSPAVGADEEQTTSRTTARVRSTFTPRARGTARRAAGSSARRTAAGCATGRPRSRRRRRCRRSSRRSTRRRC